ncbi:3-phenylpropionate/trans-cinnamate dioxygenase ferredoxin reductase subunit [Rhodoferax sp. OV413]|uniref:NAD(P)/FAD-dependent oxidoreductase n=1 Tax=Rhodoferax sp. OV413 TaxID=1855285 RepID=UPI000882305A|nr:FAD-dependent oxidoreductase [Rhodoferax sp. OV413]SDO38209.1 3-phenylpropionate/trans-cinnamate dioxygenase ferredoxin reductase subunit [Rhodoferax sp. OV413]
MNASERPEVAAAARPISTIVIAGAGQAGGWAAQTLRKEGFTGRVVLIGDESHPPHERPPLSKAVLSGEALPESTRLMKPEAFDALALDWRPGAQVGRIDRAGKLVVLTDGTALAYDKLILCTGGRARRISLPGADKVKLHTLRTIEDALALSPVLTPGHSVVVIGGGWIGLEVAATARLRGAEVVVVETQSRLCERTVPAEISEHLLALHGAQGTRVLLGAGVSGFAKNADGSSVVELADGSALACDAIVLGIGLVPNDELAREAGLDCDGGVLVDARCQSSDPDILAAGDVAVAVNPWAGRRLRLESWQNAQEQSIAAARSALGLAVDYQPLPWFWSDQYGMNLQIYGMPMPTHRVVRRGDPASGSFVLFYLADDVIQAAIGPNAARDLRFARRLIEQRKPVDPERLADSNTPMSKF